MSYRVKTARGGRARLRTWLRGQGVVLRSGPKNAEIIAEVLKLRPELLGLANEGKKRFMVDAPAILGAGAAKKPARTQTRSRVTRNKPFYERREWLELRYKVLKRDGAKCALCCATRADGVRLHVDHIKPRSLYPELELEADNLQVLCEHCNLGKSNLDDTDWRAKEELH